MKYFVPILFILLIRVDLMACPGDVPTVIEVMNPRTRSLNLYKIGEAFTVDEIRVSCLSEQEASVLHLVCKNASGKVVGQVSHDFKESPAEAPVNTGFHISQAFEGAPYSFKITCDHPKEVKILREKQVEQSKDQNRNRLYDLLSESEPN